jgi:uncharacterized protein DUF1353
MSQFTKTLVVSPLADGRTWVLREPFSYDVGTKGSYDTITVPVRFMTDFASVPRPLWWLLPPWGKYGNAAVIHDFGYWEQSRPKRRVDRIFLEGMKVLGVGVLTRYTMFLAVSLFGFVAWYSRRRRPGQHIARRFPTKCSDRRADLLRDATNPAEDS